MSVKRKRWLGILAAAAVLLVGVGAWKSVGRAQYDGFVEPIDVDLTNPDVLVRTRSVSVLPRDVMRVPLAKDLLAEDAVFYYEEHPDRLGLAGTLRRIAYEHELDWSDRIVARLLDQPAELAFWRGDDGALRYWLLSTTLPDLARLLPEMAKVALDDRQLKRAGDLEVDGTAAAVYTLEISPRRTFVLVGAGERLVVFSDPGLLLDMARTPASARATIAARLLSQDGGKQALYRESFGLPAGDAQHSVLVRTSVLSFGYQRFFPGFEALRFDFGDGGWATRVLMDGARLPAQALRTDPLWSAVPAHPASCALVPAEWALGAPILEGVKAPAGGDLAPLATALEGPAAVCWYAGGRIQAPLVAATLKSETADLGPLFQALFTWSIGRPAEGARPLVVRRTGARRVVWQREVEAPFAGIDREGEPEPGRWKVTLARHGRHVVFSPDGERALLALAALDHRYPSLADTLPTDVTTMAVLSPAGLADLGRKESLVMLPRAQEPILRAAAERHLLPRLDAFARHPDVRLALATAPPAARGWVDVEWREMRP